MKGMADLLPYATKSPSKTKIYRWYKERLKSWMFRLRGTADMNQPHLFICQMKTPRNSRLNDLSKGTQFVNSRHRTKIVESWFPVQYFFSLPQHTSRHFWSFQINIFMGHFRSFAISRQKEMPKSKIKARRQYTSLRHSMKSNAQHNLVALLESSYFSPTAREPEGGAWADGATCW